MNEFTKKNLLDLAENIQDADLREGTREVIENLEISNQSMEYGKSDLKELPCWIGGHHHYEGGLLEHIYSTTKLCMKIADQLEEVYEEKIDRDSLISASLLHDLAKQFQIKNTEEFRDYSLDHSVWISCELYSRDFPEKVIEIIMGHGGEIVQPAPESQEAKILHHADSMDASFKEEEVVIGGNLIELE